MPRKLVPLLKPGKYRLPDGRWVTYTAADIRRAVDNGNKQLAVGLTAPVAWTHDPDAEPTYLSQTAPRLHPDAWLARGYFGDARRFRFDPATGGSAAVVDIPDEKDAAQFERVKKVSPGIYQDWTDERGVFWPGLTFAHIASTPKPVQRTLEDIRPHPAHLLAHPRAGAVHLLSFPATIRSEPMADETEDTPDTTEGGGGLTAEQIAKIAEFLKEHGIVLADSVSNADELLIALESASRTLKGDTAGDSDADDPAPGAGDPGMGGGTEPVNTPVMMSNAVAARLGQLEHESKLARVKGLANRVPKPKVDELLKRLTAANLSHATAKQFAPDGTLKRTEFDAILEFCESLPASPLARAAHLSHPTAPVPAPGQTDAKTRHEQWAAELDEMGLKR